MSISQQFYLAASLKHLTGDRSQENVIRDYSAENPENQRAAAFVGNDMRPVKFNI